MSRRGDYDGQPPPIPPIPRKRPRLPADDRDEPEQQPSLAPLILGNLACVLGFSALVGMLIRLPLLITIPLTGVALLVGCLATVLAIVWRSGKWQSFIAPAIGLTISLIALSGSALVIGPLVGQRQMEEAQWVEWDRAELAKRGVYLGSSTYGGTSIVGDHYETQLSLSANAGHKFYPSSIRVAQFTQRGNKVDETSLSGPVVQPGESAIVHFVREPKASRAVLRLE